MPEACATRAQHWREQPDAMAIGARLRLVTGQRLRFRAHQRDAHLGGKLHDAIYTSIEFIRRRKNLAAAFRQMLVADPLLP